MPYRICPLCNQASYLADPRARWLCPRCGYDPYFAPGHAQRVRCAEPPVQIVYSQRTAEEKD